MWAPAPASSWSARTARVVPGGEHQAAGRAPGVRGGDRDRPGPGDVPDRGRPGTRYADPALRGHSIEFRINAEDPGRNFLPAPGTISELAAAVRARRTGGRRLRAGDDGAAGVRLADRQADHHRGQPPEALERARRALAEFEVGGMPTVLPFHRAVVRDPAFTVKPFTVHTRWIETEFEDAEPSRARGPAQADGGPPRERITVEVGGKRLEVVLPAGLGGPTRPRPARRGRATAARRQRGGRRGAAATNSSARCRARSSRSSRQRASRSRRGHRRGAGGDEDGAAADRAQGRHGDRAGRGVGQTVSAGGVICQLPG